MSVIVFCKLAGGHQQLFTANIDGTNLTQLTADTHNYNWARWSPDGSLILAGDSSQNLWVCGADGSGLRQLTNIDTAPSGLGFNQGDWSPDGTKCVVLANESLSGGDHADVQIVNIDNSGHTVITLTTKVSMYANLCLSWSPDGTKFLYPSDYPSIHGVLNATSCLIDGSSPVNILTAVPDTIDGYLPWRWYPDSTNILVVEHPAPHGPDNLLKSDGATTSTVYASGGDLNLASTLGAMTPDGEQIAWNSTASSSIETLIGGTLGGFATGTISSDGLDVKPALPPLLNPGTVSAGTPQTGIVRH